MATQKDNKQQQRPFKDSFRDESSANRDKMINNHNDVGDSTATPRRSRGDDQNKKK